MQGAEDYVRSQSGTIFILNVFGSNVVARGLYESMGCSVLASWDEQESQLKGSACWSFLV